MKFLYILLFLFIISNANGQRRTTAKPDAAEVEQPRSPPRGRGRSRFTATSEYAQISETTKSSAEPTSRRLPSRKRVSETTERRTSRPTERPLKSSYEVDEVVNESPIDSFRRQSKPRVLTESHYEALHAPKKKLIDPVQAITEAAIPESLPPLEELFKTIDTSIGNTAGPETSSAQPETTNDIGGSEDIGDTTFKTNPLDISSETSRSNEITREFTKIPTITTPKPTEGRRGQNGARRSNIRSRTSAAETSGEVVTQAPRSRTRTRPTRRPEDSSGQVSQATPSRTVNRSSRRRPETSTQTAEASKKGPSVFVAEETQEITKVRPGRRTGFPTAPEKITLDLPNGRSKDSGRKRTATPATTTTTRSEEEPRRRPASRFPSRNPEPTTSSPRFRSRSKDITPAINEFTPATVSTKGRFRSRDVPPIIDEQKLEVLPLFEAEPKTVGPVAKSRSRSRTRSINHSHESIQMSATENDLKFTPKANEIPKFSVSRTQTVNVETRTETSVKRKPVTKPPVVRESVIAEVSEVTSKRTVTRRKSNGKTVVNVKPKADGPKVTVTQVVSVSRGKKKSEVNLVDVKKKDSSEEIDDTDNYPEPFKALIQAKKNKKESRPSGRPHTTAIPTITSVVTSSAAATASTTTSTTTTTTTEKEDILDNELDPKPSSTAKPSTRPSRKRFSLTTKFPETTPSTSTTKKPTFPSRKSAKVVRSTAQPTVFTSAQKEHRFHAKFTSTTPPSTRSEHAAKGGRGTAPPRGLYSSRKNKEDKEEFKEKRKGGLEADVQSTRVPKSFTTQKKSSRYSSKYRTDTSGRGSGPRSTTNAPAYIPTIPTAAYVPTVPTVTPHRRTTTEIVWPEDAIDYNWSSSRLY